MGHKYRSAYFIQLKSGQNLLLFVFRISSRHVFEPGFYGLHMFCSM